MFLILVWLCYIFPYTGDDWAWGSSVGLERLSSWFENYNGRYAGNLAVLILTRCRFVKAIFEAICLTGIVYLIVPKRQNRFFNTVVCFLLIAAIPKFLMRQTIVWTSGFSNYTIPVVLVLIYLRYCYSLLESGDPPGNNKFSTSVAMLLFAFVSALFMEHVTIYMLFMGAAIVIYTFYKYRKVYTAYLSYFIGVAIGAAYMFSNGAYRLIASDADECKYRTIAQGSGLVSRAIENYFKVIGKELFLSNFILNICIFFAVVSLFWKYREQIKASRFRMIAIFSTIMVEAACVYSFVANIFMIFLRKNIGSIHFDGIITLLFCFCLILFCFSAVFDRTLKKKLIFLVFSIAIMTGPLLAVTPLQSRCFFPTYVLFCYFVIECFGILKMKKQMPIVALIALFLALFNLFRIYIPIYQVDIQRVDNVQAAANSGRTEAELSHFPHENYLWMAMPDLGPMWEERYKLFYDIPLNVKLKEIDYKEK
ncbi:DUF6056 family protein [Anaerovorax odorimutans]|uniref:DUF6056 family protein n=2 Tax=Anaerovorax odorimutans TaxID=109327 RepID=A0ABT1RJA8_9FIRM|nr:DUF6056 family protein [Anaerovorax odorimutans]